MICTVEMYERIFFCSLLLCRPSCREHICMDLSLVFMTHLYTAFFDYSILIFVSLRTCRLILSAPVFFIHFNKLALSLHHPVSCSAVVTKSFFALPSCLTNRCQAYYPTSPSENCYLIERCWTSSPRNYWSCQSPLPPSLSTAVSLSTS